MNNAIEHRIVISRGKRKSACADGLHAVPPDVAINFPDSVRIFDRRNSIDSVESFGDLPDTVWLFGCACQEVEPSSLNSGLSHSRVWTRPESFFVMLVPCICPACYNKSVSQRRRSSDSRKKVRPRSDCRTDRCHPNTFVTIANTLEH